MTGRSDRILLVCMSKQDAFDYRSFPRRFFKPQSQFPRQRGSSVSSTLLSRNETLEGRDAINFCTSA